MPSEPLAVQQQKCADYPGFQCALCGHGRYARLLVLREGQRPYVTDFFACEHCSTMFTDPQRFAEAKQEGTGKHWGSASYVRPSRW